MTAVKSTHRAMGPQRSGKVKIMNTRHHLRAARLGLVAALLLGGAGMATAGDVTEQAAHRISIGSSQTDVRSQLGEPLKQMTPLFSGGNAWLYYVEGSTPGEERAVQVIFDAGGMVKSTHIVDASQFALDRYHSDDRD